MVAGSKNIGVPRFEPHPLLRNGHWQTIVGRYLSGGLAAPPSRDVDLPLDDGDRLRVVDSVPEGWAAGDPSAVLVHGLAGCARSPYVVRGMAGKLVAKGIRVVRMNLRGAGAGFGLARGIYHAGKTGDLRAVAAWLTAQAPGSPIALVGFSLGGNLVLKLAAEASEVPLRGLDCVLAANAPLDLQACCRNMRRPERRIYDQNFVRCLRKEVRKLHATFPELGPVPYEKLRSVFEFDEFYTAPRNGFAGAEDYYARSPAGAPAVQGFASPGLVIHAEDDPFIPVESYRSLEFFPPSLALELIPSGRTSRLHRPTPKLGRRPPLARRTRLALWLAELLGASRKMNSTRRATAHDRHQIQ